MYTVLENARIVVSLLKKHNIHHIVLSPGGSNIPIIQAVQNDPFFTCYSVVDERSAMYFAIGIKIICLILGAVGIANMWLAIFADVGVMVIAVINAIRALFVKNLR